MIALDYKRSQADAKLQIYSFKRPPVPQKLSARDKRCAVVHHRADYALKSAETV